MLSRRQRAQENSSIDWESVKDLLRKEKEKLDRKESVDDLLRSCWAWRKGDFQGGKIQRDECNKQAIQPKIQTTY